MKYIAQQKKRQELKQKFEAENAKEKARTARKLAFDAYLEVKKIKKTYMLDDSDSDFSNSSSSENSDNDGEESDS